MSAMKFGDFTITANCNFPANSQEPEHYGQAHTRCDQSEFSSINQFEGQQTDQSNVDCYSRKNKLNGEESKDHIYRGRSKIKQHPKIQRSKSCSYIQLSKTRGSSVKGKTIEVITWVTQC